MPSPWHSSLDPAQLASSLQAWHADHPDQRLLALLAEARMLGQQMSAHGLASQPLASG